MRWPASLVDRRHSRPARIATRLIALGVLTVLPGGCSQLKAAQQTGQALARAGYKQAGVNVNTSVLNGQSSQTVVQVRYSSRASDDAALGAEQDKAAQIVWENAPVRLSAVMVTAITHQVGVPGVGGAQTSRGRAYSREELASSYGPRPAGLDNQPTSGVPPVVANLLAVLALLGAVAVVVFLAVLTFRRRRRPCPVLGGRLVSSRGPSGKDGLRPAGGRQAHRQAHRRTRSSPARGPPDPGRHRRPRLNGLT